MFSIPTDGVTDRYLSCVIVITIYFPDASKVLKQSWLWADRNYRRETVAAKALPSLGLPNY